MNCVKKLYRRIRGAWRYRNVKPQDMCDLVETILLNIRPMPGWGFTKCSITKDQNVILCFFDIISDPDSFAGLVFGIEISDLKMYEGAERVNFIKRQLSEQLL